MTLNPKLASVCLVFWTYSCDLIAVKKSMSCAKVCPFKLVGVKLSLRYCYSFLLCLMEGLHLKWDGNLCNFVAHASVP